MARRSLHFVGTDLNARARLISTAEPLGWSVTDVAAGAEVIVVDLDAFDGDLGGFPGEARVLGFFSHVDADRGRSARAAGIQAYPRSRFWRDLPEILGTESPTRDGV